VLYRKVGKLAGPHPQEFARDWQHWIELYFFTEVAIFFLQFMGYSSSVIACAYLPCPKSRLRSCTVLSPVLAAKLRQTGQHQKRGRFEPEVLTIASRAGFASLLQIVRVVRSSSAVSVPNALRAAGRTSFPLMFFTLWCCPPHGSATLVCTRPV